MQKVAGKFHYRRRAAPKKDLDGLRQCPGRWEAPRGALPRPPAGTLGSGAGQARGGARAERLRGQRRPGTRAAPHPADVVTPRAPLN